MLTTSGARGLGALERQIFENDAQPCDVTLALADDLAAGLGRKSRERRRSEQGKAPIKLDLHDAQQHDRDAFTQWQATFARAALEIRKALLAVRKAVSINSSFSSRWW